MNRIAMLSAVALAADKTVAIWFDARNLKAGDVVAVTSTGGSAVIYLQ